MKKLIHIPNPKFKTYMLEHFDRDNDGEISYEEAQTVKVIDCRDLSLYDIEGIDQFKELEFLDCSSNKLTSIDCSRNTKLRELRCDNNQLNALDLSKNYELRILMCHYNELLRLSVSNCPKITELCCRCNFLNSLDVRNNLYLRELNCHSNFLKGYNYHLDSDRQFCGYLS